MAKPTILVATWGEGLFAVTGDGRTQELADLPVRGSHRMDSAVRSPLSTGFRCAGVLEAANGQPSLRASSSFRAVWLLDPPYTLELTTAHVEATRWGRCARPHR